MHECRSAERARNGHMKRVGVGARTLIARDIDGRCAVENVIRPRFAGFHLRLQVSDHLRRQRGAHSVEVRLRYDWLRRRASSAGDRRRVVRRLKGRESQCRHIKADGVRGCVSDRAGGPGANGNLLPTKAADCRQQDVSHGALRVPDDVAGTYRRSRLAWIPRIVLRPADVIEHDISSCVPGRRLRDAAGGAFLAFALGHGHQLGLELAARRRAVNR